MEKYNQVTVVADTFKTKIILKDEMIKKTRLTFKQKYPDKYLKMRFADSAGDFNLQIADFIVGSFFRAFKDSKDIPDFKIEGLRIRIIANVL